MQPLSSSGTITLPQEIHYTHHSAISTPITEKTPIFDAGGYYHAVHHEIIKVSSEKEIGEALLKAKESSKKITISGARHSQAGHIVLDDSIHLDMTPYNKIINIDEQNKTITVQSGAIWTTVLDALSPLKLVPKIMQDKDLFTVGGSLSSNIMGRNPHDGPFIESVKSFTLMDAEGNIHKASREENSDLFSLAIGGYGLFGVILEVTLKVIPDAVVTLNKTPIPIKDYPAFVEATRNKPEVIFLVGMINTKFTQVMANVYTTSGQEIGSNSKEKTLGSLLRNKIARKYGEPWKSNNLIGCTFPLKNFAPFMQRMQSAIQETGSKINFISSKFIKKDSESVLALTKEDSIASNLMFDLTESTFKNIQELKPLLTQAAKELDGSIYLTFGHEIDKESMNILYPQLQYFLEKKLQFDPEERFSSQFYEKIK